MQQTSAQQQTRRGAVLAVMCLALALVVSANASLNIALPDISAALGSTQTDLQWTIDAYALVFAGLLLPAGAIGDRFGRKGLIVVGLLIFGAAYATAIFAATPATLIAARAVAGLGAAAIMPVTLSVITNEFPAEARDRAVAIWAGVAGAGAILGLLISGILLELASWQWVFGVNAAWSAIALIATLKVIPNSKDPSDAPLDIVGAIVSALGLGAVVYAIIEGPVRGFTDAQVLGSGAIGFALLAAFVAWELRHQNPMLDPRLFKQRGFSAGTLSIAIQFFALFGMLFALLQYVQFVLGYSPLQSALALIPMAMMLMATSRKVAPPLARRHGTTPVMSAGLAAMAIGFLVLAFAQVDSSYWHLLAGLIPLGIGMGMATAPATTAIVGSLPKAKQGVASAVNDAAREVGGALGIAVLGSIVTSTYSSHVTHATESLPPEARGAAQDSLGFVLNAAPRFGQRGADLASAAQQAFVDGLSTTFAVAAATLALGAIAVLLRGRTARHSGRAAKPRIKRFRVPADEPLSPSRSHSDPLATDQSLRPVRPRAGAVRTNPHR